MPGIFKRQKSGLGAGLLALLLLLATSLVAWAALGNVVTNISQTGTDAGYPAVAVNGTDVIAFVWSERYVNGGALQGPIILQGTTDGLNLTARRAVDNSISENDQSWAPDIAADLTTPNKMHIVWKNLFQSTTHRLFYRPCLLGATCQNEEQIVSKSDGTSVDFPRIALGLTRGGVHVVWQQAKGATERSIQYAGRTTTNSWTAPFAITSVTDGSDISHPAIAVTTDGTNDYVHVVWVNNAGTKEIRYRRGTVPNTSNTVQTWGAVKTWSNPNGNSAKGYPAIAAIGSTVVVLWDVDSGTTERYYALYDVSSDNGLTWPGPVREMLTDETNPANFTALESRVNGINTDYTKRLHIRAVFEPGSDKLHVVWHQSETNVQFERYRHVFYSSRVLSCGSNCWETPSDNRNNKYNNYPIGVYSVSPDIAVGSDGQPHVVYMEGRNEFQSELIDTVFNIIYNGAQELLPPPTFYLPIIMKNSS